MKVIPVGHRLLLKVKAVEEVSKGGILLAKKLIDEEKKAQTQGEVLALGPSAYHDYAFPWCKVGDIVLYQRYSGMRIPDEKSPGGFVPDLILINDLDVTGRIINDEEHDNA